MKEGALRKLLQTELRIDLKNKSPPPSLLLPLPMSLLYTHPLPP